MNINIKYKFKKVIIIGNYFLHSLEKKLGHELFSIFLHLQLVLFVIFNFQFSRNHQMKQICQILCLIIYFILINIYSNINFFHWIFFDIIRLTMLSKLKDILKILYF